MADRLNAVKGAEGGDKPWRRSWQELAKKPATKAFTEMLDEEALKYFQSVGKKPFSQQAVSFLNAYWPEVENEAEFIFSYSYEYFKMADMRAQGVSLIHLYNEGCDLDFDMGLYFFEQICKFLDEPKNASLKEKFPRSIPEEQTGLKRKQELREKVDVDFDGRVSFLEFLLYQYKDTCNPADFVQRSMGHDEEHPEVRKARLALEEVSKRIRAYEAEKFRLEELAKQEGVKGLGAKNMLAQLAASPLASELQAALITAEAAVRIAIKKYGGSKGTQVVEGVTGASASGAVWWMGRDLEEKQKRYGKKSS